MGSFLSSKTWEASKSLALSTRRPTNSCVKFCCFWSFAMRNPFPIVHQGSLGKVAASVRPSAFREYNCQADAMSPGPSVSPLSWTQQWDIPTLLFKFNKIRKSRASKMFTVGGCLASNRVAGSRSNGFCKQIWKAAGDWVDGPPALPLTSQQFWLIEMIGTNQHARFWKSHQTILPASLWFTKKINPCFPHP